jgi:hypothetical protein
MTKAIKSGEAYFSAVKRDILDNNRTADDAKRINSADEWRTLVNYIKDDGTPGMRSEGFRLSPEELERAIAEVEAGKK